MVSVTPHLLYDFLLIYYRCIRCANTSVNSCLFTTTLTFSYMLEHVAVTWVLNTRPAHTDCFGSQSEAALLLYRVPYTYTFCDSQNLDLPTPATTPYCLTNSKYSECSYLSFVATFICCQTFCREPFLFAVVSAPQIQPTIPYMQLLTLCILQIYM